MNEEKQVEDEMKKNGLVKRKHEIEQSGEVKSMAIRNPANSVDGEKLESKLK